MADLRAVAHLPDAVVRTDSGPVGRRTRLIVTGYGGSVRSSFSGSSGYLADAGIQDGSLDGAITLWSSSVPDRGLQLRGAAWKAQRLLRGERINGFKFSEQFSAHVWRRYAEVLGGTDLISNFQLFSRDLFRRRQALGIGAWFYLDGTFYDYLVGYSEYDTAVIDPATVRRAIEVERAGYEEADGLIVMSEFTAQTLREHYGVAPGRIRVVLPGANLTDEMAERVAAARAARPPTDDVVVGFVGVYPERKGLPKLAQAVSRLHSEGLPVRLLVVGRCPQEVEELPGVEALGFIDKHRESARFVQALARIDLGCQLSTAELFGIAVLEFLRCGVPVLATEVGGVTDVLYNGASLPVPGDVTIDGVAEEIRRFVDDEQLRRRLTAEAQARAAGLRWQATAAELGRIIEAGPLTSS